jgi:hypothetical protein
MTLQIDKFYPTFIDKNYIGYEPTRYLSDVFGVGYVFKFSKQCEIIPYFTYEVNGCTTKVYSPKQEVNINELAKVTFGPFYTLPELINPISEVTLYIEVFNLFSKLIIFKKNYLVPNFQDYSFQTIYRTNELNLNFVISSCYSLPGYRNPVSLGAYEQLKNVSKSVKPDYIFSSGDIVYLEPMCLSSELGIQAGYDQLKTFDILQGIWSNSTFICNTDDHELGYNDNLNSCPNAQQLRDVYNKNFPLNLVTDKARYSSFNVKDITFILLDDVSYKEFNTEYTGIGYNKFISILGFSQLHFFLNSLSNAQDSYGIFSPVFISVGKSMFGTINDTFVFCPQERDTIFSHIKFLGLRNVFFMCGDCHFSDLSEFVVNKDTNQKIREIRNSAIGSPPRNDPNDNQYVIPGSFVGGINNFGLVNLKGTIGKYIITYQVYTVDGIVYQIEWNTIY